MIEIKKYSAGDRDIWDGFIRSSKNGIFMFERDYMEYHSERFQDHSLMVYEDSKLTAVLPANQRDNVLFSHQGLTFGGFITDKKMRVAKMLEIFATLKTYLKEKGFKELVYKAVPHIYHSLPAEEDGYALFRNKAEIYRVDVSTTIDLQAGFSFSSGKKSGIGKAKKSGVEIHESEDFTEFFSMVEKRLDEKYDVAPTHTAKEMELLYSRFPKNIILYGAYIDEKMVAGVVMYVSGQVAHTQYISSNQKGRDVRAVDYLISHLLEVYRDKKYFDFGISNEKDGQYLNENLISQKEEFGGRSIIHGFYRMKV